MEEVSKASYRKSPAAGRKKGGRNYNKHYTPAFKLKIVKLYVEENYSASFIEQETGIPQGNVHRWIKQYRAHGESGLQSVYDQNPGNRLHPIVRNKIVELKKASPQSGVRRISDVCCAGCFFSRPAQKPFARPYMRKT